MSLENQARQLERLKFEIVSSSDDEVIAVRRQWHWDCLVTRVTYVVFVRAVPELTRAIIEDDRERLTTEAKDIAPSLLPRGFQKGTAVFALYLAGKVDPEAQEICSNKPKMQFAYFYMLGARDVSTDEAHYLRSAALWGFVYFAKFRYLIQRLLESENAPSREPISASGVFLTVVFVLTLIVPLLLFLMVS